MKIRIRSGNYRLAAPALCISSDKEKRSAWPCAAVVLGGKAIPALVLWEVSAGTPPEEIIAEQGPALIAPGTAG